MLFFLLAAGTMIGKVCCLCAWLIYCLLFCVCVCVCVFFFFGGVVFLVQFLSGSFSFCVCVVVVVVVVFFRRMAGEYNFCDLFCG